jgi:hypothetical protein
MYARQQRMLCISGNNKGLMCPFKAILCEEGYCCECQIYLDWLKLKRKASGVDRSSYVAKYKVLRLHKGKLHGPTWIVPNSENISRLHLRGE